MISIQVSRKLEKCLKDLKATESGRESSNILYLARSKAFENAIECCWKWFKTIAQKESVEVLSPKDAIRAAGKLKIIRETEVWMRYLDARNYSVHDYFGLDEKSYRQLIDSFSHEFALLVQKYS
jgi:nucleotidyltransferase substrate binding protein (TIGR01987 family)